MQSKGNLNINGGSVTATGTHKNGVYVLNNFQMTGGSLTVTGSGNPELRMWGVLNFQVEQFQQI